MRLNILFVLLVFASACSFRATSNPRSEVVYVSHATPRVLSGLRSIRLIIIVVDEDKHGLRTEAVRKDVELRLEKAKLHIISEEEAFRSTLNLPIGASLPELVVYINPDGPPIQQLAAVYLREDVTPIRNKNMVTPLDMWREETYTSRDKNVISARDAAMHLVEWFCMDYTAGNSTNH